jgi:hypothetical protein
VKEQGKSGTEKFWQRITDKDRLCYALVIAFGICLLGLMLFFQLGYQLGERQAEPFLRQENTPAEQKMLLINEPNAVVRGIEMAVALGMIALGSERLVTYKRRRLK